ncbi:MAG TPA: hypothetical protein VGB06_07280 [Solirubrobacterales bacterium]
MAEPVEHHVEVRGAESGTDRTEFKLSTVAAYQCEESSYAGTLSGSAATTTQQVTLTPTYSKCVRTLEGEDEKVEVKTNGCYFIAKMGYGGNEFLSTAELNCPTGKKIEIISGFCTIKIIPQLVTGLDYKNVTQLGKNAVTAELAVKGIAMEVHAGICVFAASTSSTAGELTGSIPVSGYTTWLEPVGITATPGAIAKRVRSEVAHTSLTGQQVAENAYTFGILVGAVKCTTASVTGTTSALATAEVTLAPTYSGCKGLEREVTVNMNGCAYVLKFPLSGSTASFAIECPAEKAIETTYDSFAGGCTITIGAQNASGNVDVKNEGAGTTRDILLTWTLSGLKYKRDGCEVGGEASNGTYTGSVTLKGQDTEGTQKGIWYG